VGSLIASLLVMPAVGATETEGPEVSQVDAIVGLAPVLSLSCTDVNLGVWRPKPGARGGFTTITLTVEGSTTKYAITDNTDLALAAGYSAKPVAGICTIANSNNPGITSAKLILTSPDAEFETAYVLNRKKAVKGLKGPNGLKAALVVDNNGLATVNAVGAATWRIRGKLTIPDGVVLDNYGGYMNITTTSATYQSPAED
jgi:hypothetical protein